VFQKEPLLPAEGERRERKLKKEGKKQEINHSLYFAAKYPKSITLISLQKESFSLPNKKVQKRTH